MAVSLGDRARVSARRDGASEVAVPRPLVDAPGRSIEWSLEMEGERDRMTKALWAARWKFVVDAVEPTD